MNYYQFHIGDYASNTSHLSDEEDLTYRRLLDFYYKTEQPIQNFDIEKVARKIRCNPDVVRTIVEEFFDHHPDDSSWHNKRADEEISKFHLKSDRAKNANLIRWESKMDVSSDADQIATNNHKPITNKEHIDRFDQFWKKYPRKVAKPNALKSWLKVKPDDELTGKIIAAIDRQGLCNREMQFVPHPATWLNGHRWEDEVTPNVNQNQAFGRRVL